MIKRLTALLLAIVMLANLSACAQIQDQPKMGETDGDKESLYGFTLIETRDFPLVGAEVMHYEHIKTGATLVYISNSDTNRVFDLTFRTRAEDDKGVPHVFEHAALKGSEKYPDSGLFFHLLYQTYNTYMNAETGAAYTTYPVSSLSEKQLLAYADYYTDSCLHPCVLRDESIFREEAWRYRLESEEEPLRIEGTVYSEMLAASNLYQGSYSNMLRAAFPGSVSGNVSGGDPEKIPEMTWEDLKDYHARYYHPSNCTAYLYGKFDEPEAFFKLLDEYFSDYERKEFLFEDEGWTPVTSDREVFDTFPVEEDYFTESASELYYIFLCPGLKEDPQEEMYLNTMTDLMSSDSSPICRNLAEALPEAFMFCWISVGTPQDAVIFNISGIDEDDVETAKSAIDAGLREIADKGFSQEMVDSLSAAMNMNMRLSRENTALGLSLLTGQMIPYYAESGKLFSYIDYTEALSRVNEWNSEGIYAKAADEWLVNCSAHVVSLTSPAPGEREVLNEAEETRLAQIKASMNAEEIEALIEQTLAAGEEEDETNCLDRLQAVTVQSLPEEIRNYEIAESGDGDGVRWLSAEAEVEDVGMPVILLDSSGIAQEDLHWFVLYLSLVGQMDTDKHTKEELQELRSRYLYGAEIRQSLLDEYGTKNFHPFLRAGWISSGEDLEKSYDLLSEFLWSSSFTDTEALAGQIERNRTAMRNMISYSAYNTMMYRALGAESPMYAYYSYCSGLEYYAFLEQVSKMMQDDPSAVAQKLEQIQSQLHNRTNAISLFAGDKAMIEQNRTLCERFFEQLDAREIETVAYSFETPASYEALVVEDSVQYNGLVASFEEMGLQGYTADMDAVSSLVTDLYLIPLLREEYGVYSPMHYYDSFAGSYLISYRDPNIEETFSVYDTLGEMLEAENVDQETLDGYILSCYSAYSMPEGELSGAVTALISHLCGEPEDLKIRHMEELKTLTGESLREYAEAYRKLAENGLRFTVGSESAISEHEDMFDRILRPFDI